MNISVTYSNKEHLSPLDVPVTHMFFRNHTPSICYHISPLSTTYAFILYHSLKNYKSNPQKIYEEIMKKDYRSVTKKRPVCTGRNRFFSINYASLDFATSASVANPSASFTAISASIFLFISTPASFSPYINLL